jgi:hypothetical protein
MVTLRKNYFQKKKYRKAKEKVGNHNPLHKTAAGEELLLCVLIMKWASNFLTVNTFLL